MNIRNWVLGAVFLVEGGSVNAQQQAPQSFCEIQKAKGETKSYPIPNGNPVTKNVIDVSYDKLVEYACRHWREIDWNRLSRNESERILRKMRLLTFAGPEFAEKVLPEDTSDESKLFMIDSKYDTNKVPHLTQFEFEFIREILKAILRNPVGEARVKSILLLSCLQEAELIGGVPILKNNDGFQEQIVVETGNMVDLKNEDDAGSFVENHLRVGNIVSSVINFYQISKNKKKSEEEINEIVQLLVNLWNKSKQYNSVNSAKKDIIKGDALKILEGFDIIATAMIHEMSHPYHQSLGFNDDFFTGGYKPLYTKNCVSAHKDMQKYWYDNEIWNFSLDDILVELGLSPYVGSNDKFIIEDHINENTARFYAGEPFRFGHKTPKTSKEWKKKLEDEIKAVVLNWARRVAPNQNDMTFDSALEILLCRTRKGSKAKILEAAEIEAQDSIWKLLESEREIENSLFTSGTADCLNDFYSKTININNYNEENIKCAKEISSTIYVNVEDAFNLEFFE